MRQRVVSCAGCLILLWALSACSSEAITGLIVDDSVPRHALSDPGNWSYLGYPGGQYPAGAMLPAAHRAAGLNSALSVRPLAPNGAPSPAGKIVLLSIGMSNTTQEFCNASQGGSCGAGTFVAQALVDPAVQHGTLLLVDGARSGQTAESWDAASDPNYDQVRDIRLASAGATEQQVQVGWVKVANPRPTISLTAPAADAYRLVTQIGAIVRALKLRYPNLKLVFLSNRTYAGYATTDLNPEPYAYESGFAVKWVIEAQLTQMASGQPDPRAGNLDYGTVAPWLGWGPDLWANGTVARADGLLWNRGDFQSDGTHPSAAGVQKVGRLLLDFFKASPVTRCWFLVSGACG